MIDQDRLAGLRTSLGGAPPAIPLETVVKVPELGASRTGLTEVVANDWSGYLLFLSLLGSIDSTFDASGSGTDYGGRGTASAWWTFEGLRDDGTPWKLERGNRWVSKFQIGLAAALNPGFQLDTLIYNPWEQITVTKAQVTLSLEKAVKLYTIKEILVAKGNGAFKARNQVSVKRGSKLRVRVVLRKFQGGTKTVDYVFRIRKTARCPACSSSPARRRWVGVARGSVLRRRLLRRRRRRLRVPGRLRRAARGLQERAAERPALRVAALRAEAGREAQHAAGRRRRRLPGRSCSSPTEALGGPISIFERPPLVRRPQPFQRFVIGVRRSRPNAFVRSFTPGRRLAALVLGAVDQRRARASTTLGVEAVRDSSSRERSSST